MCTRGLRCRRRTGSCLRPTSGGTVLSDRLALFGYPLSTEAAPATAERVARASLVVRNRFGPWRGALHDVALWAAAPATRAGGRGPADDRAARPLLSFSSPSPPSVAAP